MDTEHDLTLLFKIAEHFIDNDGHDCTDQYVQYLAENIIASVLHNPEFVGAIYDGEQLIDEDGRVLQDFIAAFLDLYGYIINQQKRKVYLLLFIDFTLFLCRAKRIRITLVISNLHCTIS